MWPTEDARVVNGQPSRTELTYGSDLSGLICGFLFSQGLGNRSINSTEAESWLIDATLRNNADFVWLHLSRSNSSTEKWLKEHVTLPEHFFQTLNEGTGSTRVERADDCLIAVINDVTYDFSYEVSEIATLWMCVCRNFVITTRLHPLRSVDRLRVSVKAGETFSSPVALLVHLLRDQSEVLQQIERKAAMRVDLIEDNLLAGRINANRSALGAIRRVFVRLRRLLAPEPGALFRLLNRPPNWFDDEDAQDLRLATEEFSTVLSDMSSLQERTKLLQEEIVAHTSEQTNRSIYMLTIATVLALPINIIAGFFGMNVGGIPLAQDQHGFWIIAAFVASFTAMAVWLFFFRKPT